MTVIEAINQWVAAVNAQVMPQAGAGKHHVELDHANMSRQKFARIRHFSCRGNGTAWAFVALGNGENKQLGRYNAGDIFKAATWKKPAKHARGNVFEARPLCGIVHWTGPNYLRP